MSSSTGVTCPSCNKHAYYMQYKDCGDELFIYCPKCGYDEKLGKTVITRVVDLAAIHCPSCNSTSATRMFYGGERGEKGPFVHCDTCGYDGETEANKPKPGPTVYDSHVHTTAAPKHALVPIEPTDVMVMAALRVRYGDVWIEEMERNKGMYKPQERQMRRCIKEAIRAGTFIPYYDRRDAP